LTQTLAVEVNGHAATRITLSEGWQSVDARIPAAFWSEGLNEIRLVYGWTVEAGSVYRGSDPRQIAYRLERLRLQIIK
jgi:hypothetical protein